MQNQPAKNGNVPKNKTSGRSGLNQRPLKITHSEMQNAYKITPGLLQEAPGLIARAIARGDISPRRQS